MKRVNGITALLSATLLATTLLLWRCQPVVAAASPSPAGIKNVVLVHGAFADGAGWAAVAKLLVHEADDRHLFVP